MKALLPLLFATALRAAEPAAAEPTTETSALPPKAEIAELSARQ